MHRRMKRFELRTFFPSNCQVITWAFGGIRKKEKWNLYDTLYTRMYVHSYEHVSDFYALSPENV